MYVCNGKDNHKAATYRVNQLSKRLAYILRYGAEKERLTVLDGGYVPLNQLVQVPLLAGHSYEEILSEIVNSTSYRGVTRFQRKFENGENYVRASYARKLERDPYHEGSNIMRLTESCMNHICCNLQDYDMENFPDEFLLNCMIHKLKRKKKLSNKALRCLLSPCIEHLDLDGVYLTEGSIRILGQKCPHLRVLSLKNCGFVMTDHFVELILRKSPDLECLNLVFCSHLTDRTLKAICKYTPNIKQLNLAHVPALTQEGILNLVVSCTHLQQLDIYDNKNLDSLGRETLVEIAKERKFLVVLKGLHDKDVAPENPCALLPNFGKVW